MRRNNSSEACDFCLDDETERGPLQLYRHALRRCDGLSAPGPFPAAPLNRLDANWWLGARKLIGGHGSNGVAGSLTAARHW